MPEKVLLEELYQVKNMSISQIALVLGLSKTLISSKLKACDMPLRSKAEAAYVQHKKVFDIKTRLSAEEAGLYGVGIGLYWGEGNKVDPYSVRLGNTDRELILTFIRFFKSNVRRTGFRHQVWATIV